MELKSLTKKFAVMGNIKYALLIAIVGVGILLLPTKNKDAEPVSPHEILESESKQDMETRLEDILSQVEGAGSVRVMLTEKSSGETEYQTDAQILTDGQREEQRLVTVFSNDEALVVRQTKPEYLGAVIVCQGGDSPNVCLKLVKATCSLTGLTSNKITVLKMKE